MKTLMDLKAWRIMTTMNFDAEEDADVSYHAMSEKYLKFYFISCT